MNEYFRFSRDKVIWSLIAAPYILAISLIIYELLWNNQIHLRFEFFLMFTLLITLLTGTIVSAMNGSWKNKRLTKILLIVIGAILLIGVVFAYFGFVEPEKPAIYLYPESEQNIDVEVHIFGKMTTSIPAYKKGWHITATPSGKINKRYDYLYYEAALFSKELPKEHWCVTKNTMPTWLDTTLPTLGLNEKEIADFKEYWIERLPEETYQVYLADERLLSKMQLDITPKPQTEIRVILGFEPVDVCTPAETPAHNPRSRNGFTVVEWGGFII